MMISLFGSGLTEAMVKSMMRWCCRDACCHGPTSCNVIPGRPPGLCSWCRNSHRPFSHVQLCQRLTDAYAGPPSPRQFIHPHFISTTFLPIAKSAAGYPSDTPLVVTFHCDVNHTRHTFSVGTPANNQEAQVYARQYCKAIRTAEALWLCFDLPLVLSLSE